MTKSFYEQEDLGLASCLLSELPSILNWGLEGRDRLERRGYFIPPASSAEVARELEDLGSPIQAFLRDRCEVAPGQTTEVATLFSNWQNWCGTQGRDRAGTAQSFGRDLRAAVPGLRVVQPRNGSDRHRYYEGVGLLKQ
jgi:putative DNA primase/helicase